jgi:small basic protein
MARTRNRPARREADRRLTKVGLLSVTLVSFIVAVLISTMFFIAGLILWRYGVGAGAVEQAEEFIGNLTTEGAYVLDGPTLFVAWAALSAMWAVAITLLGVSLGVIVNVACLLTGGIRMRFRWNAPARTRRRAVPASEEASDDHVELEGQQELDLDLDPDEPEPPLAEPTPDRQPARAA